jgi:hypothetical protein
MKKVIRNNKVAVLRVGSDKGGFYSINNKHKELLFHPKLVEMVEQNRGIEISNKWVKENLGLDNIDCTYANCLTIDWIPVGTSFEVINYSGSEVLRIPYDLIVA